MAWGLVCIPELVCVMSAGDITLPSIFICCHAMRFDVPAGLSRLCYSDLYDIEIPFKIPLKDRRCMEDSCSK